ncbi:HNH endonuclease [Burkholderia pseudomallei]|uniref:HNH endonuclease n=1 Tax=Burkholderia pseudomallei TaxID=28450 RepID=UPI000F2A1721|nr:hypothetical protein [Burkholderia pseudomallei]CAJ3078684.1 Uncharacterised protein [Burkholderia pseudomallei]VCK72356.1 Uncharacterised protein [Burkholderia pseudomallei]VCK79778.1 Uncharacterised protein [Burkholderia pseudomallei]VCK80226.1 Uncharacterised protein [Burkholderia pseudomallei]VCK80606.1 Uncharacterised protein [Burkholderia pseudomallei]
MAHGKPKLPGMPHALPSVQYALGGSCGAGPKRSLRGVPAAMPHVAFAVPANARAIAQQRATETRVATVWEALAANVTPADYARYPLQIELVPELAQRVNLRFFLAPGTWAAIREQKAREANHVCELCHRPTPKPDCHEQWSYIDGQGIQRLDGLWCLCRACHSVKHLGFSFFKQRDARETLGRLEEAEAARLAAEAAGRVAAIDPDALVSREVARNAYANQFVLENAMAHMQVVNGIGRPQANAYFRWTLDRQRARQSIAWRIDLDWLLRWLATPEREHIALHWSDADEPNKLASRLTGLCATRPERDR